MNDLINEHEYILTKPENYESTMRKIKHKFTPGEIKTLSSGTKYEVQKDGSIKKIVDRNG